MLPEALTALSAAGGAAVVQAAGSDAWATFRARLARWFGQGDEGRERAELERLDQTAAALDGADERLRIRQEAAWQTRIEALLEHLTVRERYELANALLDLIPEDQRAGHAERLAEEAARVAAPGGIAVGGDLSVHAEGNSSVAAGVIHGGVTIHNAPSPRPARPRPPEG
ncbi:hypothetical protein [Streptomyces sp. 6N223]|uniref:hypothetical protein n=1 Tax=Streptomyces sp. 6N223 TaxID=3457412 RepID=UPI003FD5EF04